MVADVIGPGPAAHHGATCFRPDAEWQTGEVARRYQKSGRLHTYLGDWHTHPHGSGFPSRRDRRTMAVVAHTPAARAPHPLLLIVEGTPDGPLMVWRRLGCWRPLQHLTVRTYTP